MNIILYNTSSDKKDLHKNLSNSLGSSTFEPKGDMDILRPYIILNHVGNTFKTANYCYIEELGRYYFIVSKRGLIGGRMAFELMVDPLVSFSSPISNLYVLADRGSKAINNPYYDNGTLVTDCKHTKQIINFSDGFSNSGTYILITCGAPAEEP